MSRLLYTLWNIMRFRHELVWFLLVKNTAQFAYEVCKFAVGVILA